MRANTGSSVALYCRISVDRSGRRETVEEQEDLGRAYAAERWPGLPVRVFADNDRTAAREELELPGLDALRTAVRAGEIRHLWAKEQSRLSRTVKGKQSWFEVAFDLDDAGIAEVHTAHDGIVRVDDDVSDLKAVMAYREVKRLKQRLRVKQDALAARGRPAGAVVFGYTHPDTGTKDEKRLLMHPEQAEIVRESAARILAGWSLAAITADLRKRKITGVQGGTLTPSGVRKIVTNPTVANRRIHRGDDVGPGCWEPILDESTWRAVRARLAAPRVVTRADGGEHAITGKAWHARAGRRYLLTGGLARCALCDGVLVGVDKQYRSGHLQVRAPYLLCTKTSPGGGGCGKIGIKMAPVDDYVVDQLWQALDNPAFRAALGADDDHATLRQGYVNELSDLDGQRRELATRWGTRKLSTVEWDAAKVGIDATERELQAALRDLPTPITIPDVDTARAAWEDMTLDERREFVRLFITRVVIRPARPGTKTFDSNRVEIVWRAELEHHGDATYGRE